MRWMFAIGLVSVMSLSAQAQDLGARQFASQLSSSRGIFHDRSFRGAEVVFKSSGVATEAEAMAWWQNSPGHASLINAGAITSIQCSGSACVGRGPGLNVSVGPVRKRSGLLGFGLLGR